MTVRFLWVVTSCRLAGGYKCIGETYCLRLVRNTDGIHLNLYVTSLPRRTSSSRTENVWEQGSEENVWATRDGDKCMIRFIIRRPTPNQAMLQTEWRRIYGEHRWPCGSVINISTECWKETPKIRDHLTDLGICVAIIINASSVIRVRGVDCIQLA
jgi:hypothetical protein